ncbi:uncharacterized protein C5orf34-like isoform X2 [Lytechinus variegatus]|uniref:uncharacterized protein C5orf34-like isoform X2 n=1 Tax=Lytechinus variegatus TaxID=7654 RepID=UPI001BB27839|nr:uncharacterized protein C5orf34-like isoform X2 [Lytechinus variegatus]
MMDSDVRPVSMVMTCDDAVEMTFVDGSRVQLSPCGSCFIYDPPSSQEVSHSYQRKDLGPSHPLYASNRIQQRTCFVTSICRSKVKAALEFRNRFASCPFLCAATTQGESTLELYTNITQVEWSKSDRTGTFSQLPDHSLELTSVDSLATMILSPNGQDFSVKYLCKLQPDGERPLDVHAEPDHQMAQSSELSRDYQESLRCHQRTTSDVKLCRDHDSGGFIYQGEGQVMPHCQVHGSDPKVAQRISPEDRDLLVTGRMRCKFWYMWVIQNHSVAHCPWYWRLPLNLLLNHHASLQKTPDESTTFSKGNVPGPMTDKLRNQSSPVPPSLPLRCGESHLHKHHWRPIRQECTIDDRGEADTLTMYGRKVSVLVVGGVVYRLFWNPVPSMEIYPGNGDVILSSDERGCYFRLLKVCPGDGALKELMISVSNPIPDPPQSSYSIADLVQRTSRLLHCMSVHLRTAGDTGSGDICCWKKLEQDDALNRTPSVLLEKSVIPSLGQLEAYEGGLIRGFFYDGVTIETKHISPVQFNAAGVDMEYGKDEESIFTIVMADGLHKKVTSLNPGVYVRHINALLEWKRWVFLNCEGRLALIRDEKTNQEISRYHRCPQTRTISVRKSDRESEKK